MAQSLRVLDAFVEGLGMVPSIHVVAHSGNSSVCAPIPPPPLFGLCGK